MNSFKAAKSHLLKSQSNYNNRKEKLNTPLDKYFGT